MTMKLWLISQGVNGGYDTYDSAVVVAETADEARAIHPGGEIFGSIPEGEHSTWMYCYPTWARHPDQVTAEHIGTTDLPSGRVLCASFNAG